MSSTKLTSKVNLPEPVLVGDVSVEAAMQKRRSVREFGRKTVTLEQVSQLAWAAQGVTGPKPYKRAAPSAGGRCPLELYVLVGEIAGIEPGLYRYLAQEHILELVRSDDLRQEVGRSAAGQTWLADAPVVFLFTAVYERTTSKYGQRGFRYVHMDVAFAAENLHLQAVALDLGTVVMGACTDTLVSQAIGLPNEEQPLLIMPVG